jgi:gliding motility-associated-like protein
MPISQVVSPDTFFCTHPMKKLNATGSSTGANISFNWQSNSYMVDGKNTLTPTVIMAGTYFLTVTDNLTGCSSISSVEVVDDENNPQIFFESEPFYFSCDIDTITLKMTTMPIGPAYTYQWSKPEIVDNLVLWLPLMGQQADSIIATDTGDYLFEVTNPTTGCKALVVRNLFNYFDTPDVFAGDDVYLGCSGNGIAILTATTTTPTSFPGFQWYEESGSWLNPYEEAEITVNNGGRYIVKHYDVYNGCYDLDTVFVFTEDYFAQVKQPNDTLTCSKQLVQLDGSASAMGTDYTQEWYTNNGHFDGNTQHSVAFADSVGVYFLVVKNIAGGCADTAMVSVIADRNKPIIDLPNQYILPCEPDNINLVGNASTNGNTLIPSWETMNGHILSGSSTFSANIDKSGIYSLTVTDIGNDCSSNVVTSVVEPLKFEINAISIQTTCHGYEDGEIIISATPNLLWSLEGSIYSTQTSYSGLSFGDYQIVAKDTFGCKKDTLLTILEPTSIWVNLGEDMKIKVGKDTLLQIESNVLDSLISSLEWFENGLSLCNDCSETIISPKQEGYYSVLLTDVKGCTTTDSLYVILIDASRFIPNAFSPDADGFNDVFLIYSGNSKEEIQYFEIFDRWGTLIFRKENIHPNATSEGWDGTYKGKNAPNGVYIWQAQILENGLKKTKLSGDILLNRNSH